MQVVAAEEGFMKLYEELRSQVAEPDKKMPNLCSVVIPIFNEEEIIPILYERLTAMAASSRVLFEFVIIDDSSTDASLPMLLSIHHRDPRFKVISFSRNFGHQAAITAGIKHSAGDVIAIMDGDLQDPPELIPVMLDKLVEGYDVIFGIRRKRKESLAKRVAYNTFYRMLRLISSIDIPLDSGDFSVMRRNVVDVINSLPERNKFIRGIRSWVGFQQTGFEYERDRRYAGKTKYSLSKLINLALDGMISFSVAPLRLAIYVGFIISALCFLLGLVSVIFRIFDILYVPGWTSLFLSMLLLGGIEILILGIIGEYIGRIYDEAKDRPCYIISRTIGFDTTHKQPNTNGIGDTLEE